MKNYFNQIEVKLKKQIEIEDLLIVDNSHKHKGHKFFSPEKFHLHLKIKSLYLNSISRVSAQKLVMKVLDEDLKLKIHALEISIEQ
jgi:stress-induced morphogen|tara:strand:+ start:235 stop:492 length:258 start_codon:yes stop_codon:yes gene_type:complete